MREAVLVRLAEPGGGAQHAFLFAHGGDSVWFRPRTRPRPPPARLVRGDLFAGVVSEQPNTFHLI